MQVVIDMNLSPLWAPFLVSKGIDAIHWSTIGDARATDLEILEYAFKNDSLIFTNHLDFGTILSRNRSRLPSIIQIRMLEISVDQVGNLLVKCQKENMEVLSEGALITIETNRLLIRHLPIHGF